MKNGKKKNNSESYELGKGIRTFPEGETPSGCAMVLDRENIDHLDHLMRNAVSLVVNGYT